jgi:uncharacterized protein
MHQAIEANRAAISELCERYNVNRLDVFGSAARGADFDDIRSDADFLVEFRRPASKPALEEYFGLREELSKLLGRAVDLVETRAIANPYVMANINRSRQLVYAA